MLFKKIYIAHLHLSKRTTVIHLSTGIWIAYNQMPRESRGTGRFIEISLIGIQRQMPTKPEKSSNATFALADK